MVHTPLTPPPDHMSDGDIKTQYPILIGKLLWVATTVQPDLSFTINTLTWHMSKLTESVMQAALWVMKYLNQTCDKVLQLGGEGKDKLVITAYTDANWASDPITNQQSTSGLVVKVFGSLVTWNSHVQMCMSNSAVEAKYVASLAAACEALFH